MLALKQIIENVISVAYRLARMVNQEQSEELTDALEIVENSYNQAKEIVADWELLAKSKVDFVSENSHTSSRAESEEINRKHKKASLNFSCICFTTFIFSFLSIESLLFIYEHISNENYFFIFTCLIATPVSSIISKFAYNKINDERRKFLISSFCLLLSSIFIGSSFETKAFGYVCGRLLIGLSNSSSLCDSYYMHYCRVVEIKSFLRNLNLLSNVGCSGSFIVSLVVIYVAGTDKDRIWGLMHLYGLIGLILASMLVIYIYAYFSSPSLLYADDFFDLHGKRSKLEKEVSEEIKEIDQKLKGFNEFVDYSSTNLVEIAVTEEIKQSILDKSSDLNRAKRLSTLGLITIVTCIIVSFATFIFLFIKWKYELTSLLLNMVVYSFIGVYLTSYSAYYSHS